MYTGGKILAIYAVYSVLFKLGHRAKIFVPIGGFKHFYPVGTQLQKWAEKKTT